MIPQVLYVLPNIIVLGLTTNIELVEGCSVVFEPRADWEADSESHECIWSLARAAVLRHSSESKETEMFLIVDEDEPILRSNKQSI